MRTLLLLAVAMAGCSAKPPSSSSGTSSGSIGASSASGSSSGSTGASTSTSGSTGAALPGFYVAVTGDDANPGTVTAPWRTIQHAANATEVTPGSTVYVRGGSYRELVTIGVSGSASGGPITFRSYPGETPTIDGTGLHVTGQQGLVTVIDRSSVTLDGFEIANLTDSTTTAVPIGIYLSGHGDHLRILNNHIHHITTTGPQTPGCTNTSTTPNSNALGLLIAGTDGATPLSQITIDGNELDHLVLGCSESLTVNGNVQNFEVTNNRVHDNNNIGIDAIGFEHVSPDPATDQARDGVIRGNVVYNIDSRGMFGLPPNGAYSDSSADGIYLDGAARVVVERNLVHHADLGIELASEMAGTNTSNCVARNNIVYNSVVVGISIGGYSSSVGGTANCAVVNNTLYDNDTRGSGSGELQIMFNATGNTIQNNIVSASAQGVLVSNVAAYSSSQATLDYNLYSAPAGAPTLWSSAGSSSTSLAAFKASTSMDGHSAFADPLFLGAASTPPDLDIDLASPARGAGVVLDVSLVGAVDYAGNPRVQGTRIDIGAFEK
jgi:parallel beta-helix repeat protein